MVVFYISGHGFGHASRVIEVVNALLARRPDVRVHVRTRAARWLFDLTVRGPFTLDTVDTDVGVVQIDALTPDLPATLDRAGAFYADADARIAREAEALRALDATAVVADLPPLAFPAAARAGVPAVALGNFTWDWIYDDLATALGRRSDLAERIRAWHGLAREAWRLPMHGGFEGVGRIRDLPLVCRRSRRAPDETRARLGLAGQGPVVLVSFGGVGLHRLPLARVALGCDLTLVTTDEPGGAAGGPGALLRHPSSHVVAVDEHRLYAEGLRYEDLVAAADVVVTKPGYGIIAECVANDTALLFTSRGRFAEYDVLVQAMPRYLRCGFIPQDDLLAGRWAPHLGALLAQPAPPERPPIDGADVAAGWLEDLLALSSPSGR